MNLADFRRLTKDLPGSTRIYIMDMMRDVEPAQLILPPEDDPLLFPNEYSINNDSILLTLED